jgi:hypothetical protein
MCFLDDIFCYGLLAIAHAFGTALPVTLYLVLAMMQRGRVRVIAPSLNWTPPKWALHFLHVNSPVDIERLARDVVSIHDQVTGGASNLLGSPDATERDSLQD